MECENNITKLKIQRQRGWRGLLHLDTSLYIISFTMKLNRSTVIIISTYLTLDVCPVAVSMLLDTVHTFLLTCSGRLGGPGDIHYTAV
jgi:hypothetical protein